MSDDNKTGLITFFDSLGRTIIGDMVGETPDAIKLKNPVVVNVVPRQMKDPNTGETVTNMSLQLLPLFFREFLAEDAAGITYCYKKANITLPDVQPTFDFKLKIRYDSLFAPMNKQGSIPQTLTESKPEEPKVIKLFED